MKGGTQLHALGFLFRLTLTLVHSLKLTHMLALRQSLRSLRLGQAARPALAARPYSLKKKIVHEKEIREEIKYDKEGWPENDQVRCHCAARSAERGALAVLG